MFLFYSRKNTTAHTIATTPCISAAYKCASESTTEDTAVMVSPIDRTLKSKSPTRAACLGIPPRFNFQTKSFSIWRLAAFKSSTACSKLDVSTLTRCSIVWIFRSAFCNRFTLSLSLATSSLLLWVLVLLDSARICYVFEKRRKNGAFRSGFCLRYTEYKTNAPVPDVSLLNLRSIAHYHDQRYFQFLA